MVGVGVAAEAGLDMERVDHVNVVMEMNVVPIQVERVFGILAAVVQGLDHLPRVQSTG